MSRAAGLALAVLLGAGAPVAAARSPWVSAPAEPRVAEDQEALPPSVAGGAADRLQAPRVVPMVRAAQHYLVKNQAADGSFGLLRGERESGSDAPVAVTALAALALMADGHLPDRPQERTSRDLAVARAVDWLVDHCLEGGEDSGYFTTDADTVSKMHGQGYALLALTQAVGMAGDNDVERARLAAAVARGVALVQRTQGTHGGWYYEPRRMAAHEGSITVCMLQALRGARDAGFTVDADIVAKAESYLVKSQDPVSGRFRYQIGSDQMSWALTAAALSTLNAIGDYGSPMLRSGFEALRRHDPYTGAGDPEQFQDYGALYAAQAYFAWGEARLFEEWWPHFVADAESRLLDDGSFAQGGYGERRYGRLYATAMTVLTLQVPFGYLPLFQR